MNNDRVKGAAKQAKGSIKDAAGNLLGDTKLQTEGKSDKLHGKIQNTIGGIKDAAKEDSEGD